MSGIVLIHFVVIGIKVGLIKTASDIMTISENVTFKLMAFRMVHVIDYTK